MFPEASVLSTQLGQLRRALLGETRVPQQRSSALASRYTHGGEILKSQCPGHTPDRSESSHPKTRRRTAIFPLRQLTHQPSACRLLSVFWAHKSSGTLGGCPALLPLGTPCSISTTESQDTPAEGWALPPAQVLCLPASKSHRPHRHLGTLCHIS